MMADGRHIENQRNRDLSMTVWPIAAKCGTEMHY